ncbi:hypothetical protein EWM64_g1740 [Hericium alpestre]|uniref:Thioredoxin domain-containing protein n=1 Tax=Hericium alpestre TaxID=135208 RepID=A0A4Z0A9Q6_9AGAM|nr:hypothetical protein EWM64_g1740 [Hericium alpestre]
MPHTPNTDTVLGCGGQVIDFHATWCGPCHMIAPFYESLAKKHANVNFLKCDVDAAKDVAGHYSVSAMPTFVFLKGSSKVDQVRGADKSGLERAVNKHASGSAPTAFSGEGHTLGGSSSTPKRDASSGSVVAGFTNLDSQVKILLLLVAGYLFFWYMS